MMIGTGFEESVRGIWLALPAVTKGGTRVEDGKRTRWVNRTVRLVYDRFC